MGQFVLFPFKLEKQFRLPGWDYSSNGYYFITICCQDRQKILSNIIVGTDPCVRSSLSSPSVGTDPCVRSSLSSPSVGTVRACPPLADIRSSQTIKFTEFGEICKKWWIKIPEKFPAISLNEFVVMPNHIHGILIINHKIPLGEERTHGSVPTKFGNVGMIGHAIQWFKTMSTNEYIKNVRENDWPKFHKKIWQTKFYDKIIRTEKRFWIIRQYIINNPKNWDKDKYK